MCVCVHSKVCGNGVSGDWGCAGRSRVDSLDLLRSPNHKLAQRRINHRTSTAQDTHTHGQHHLARGRTRGRTRERRGKRREEDEG